MAAKKLTTKEAIEKVLDGNGKMKVRAIIDAAVPMTALKGKTPGQVIYSVLYSENKKSDGLVTQTGKGEFKLNPKRKAAGAKPAAKPAKPAVDKVAATDKVAEELASVDVDAAVAEATAAEEPATDSAPAVRRRRAKAAAGK